MKTDEPFDRLLEHAARPRDGEAPACLDAETLAAWTDGSLTASQRSLAEAHAADCDRCLAVLAAIARTAPPPFEAAQPSWLSVRWLVPLTTAAVAITAWVLIQKPGEPSRPVDSIAPVAIDKVAPAPPTALPPAQPERDVTAEARRVAPQAKKEVPTASARARGQGRGGGSAREDKRVAANAKIAQDALGARAASPPITVTASPQAAAAPPPPVAPELLQRQARFAAAPVVIASPDPSVRWRLVGSTVERSTDGGQTWTVQRAGPSVQLVAGAAPDPRICWLVGPGGVVLLTVDGATWRRLDFPDPTANLTRVTARDALTASVTTADGRTYTTDDGGRTWRLQENSGAAF